MAQSITDAPKRGRGRPKKAPITGTPGERKEAADTAAAMVQDPKLAPPAPAGKAHTGPPASVPGFGANSPTVALILSHVHKLNAIQAELDKQKLVMKELNGKKKDQRQLAKADGIVLRELDEAIEAANTERVDLVARQDRLRFYYEALGLPWKQADLFEEDARLPTLDQDKAKWRALGNTDGRMGKPCRAPSFCPPICVADYEHGYKDGQAALMAESPLTASAFNEDGTAKEGKPADQVDTWDESKTPAEIAAGTPATPASAAKVIMLANKDFLDTVKTVDDCSRATLSFADTKRAWDGADTVVVYFKNPDDGRGVKRILKSPAAGVEGEEGYQPAYEDLGDVNGELTDAEEVPAEEFEQVLDTLVDASHAPDETFGGEKDLGAEMLEAIAEVEPEIVAQVIEDHGEELEGGAGSSDPAEFE